MAGTIRTYQKCPGCGSSFPSSKGGFPIICASCHTQPTKFFINVFWQNKHEFIYHDSDGRGIHDWGHAVAVLGEIRSRMASHKTGKGFFDPSTYKKQSSNSFTSFWESFIKGYHGPTLEKLKTINNHHFTYFHDMKMRDITARNINDWWRDIQDKGNSPRYCNDIQTWLRTFLNEALSLDVIEKIPNMPTFLKTVQADIEFLTEDEQLAVLGAIPEHDRPIFDFLFLTGVRVNEACALQRSDIDIKSGVVTIRNTIKRDGSIGIVKNKKPRRIPHQAVAFCFNPQIINISGFVFINKWGKHYSDDYLRDTFNRACDEIGVRRIQLKNATRHSFGMGLLGKGYDIWQVSKIMNHSDIKITEHYAKMMDKEISGAYGRRSKTVSNIKNYGDK